MSESKAADDEAKGDAKAPEAPEVDADADAASKAPEAPEAAPASADVERSARAKQRAPWLLPESRSRRVLFALGVYAACLVVYALVAGDRMLVHTPYNHFAHQAYAWLQGRHDLAGGPPGYAGGNDFALFQG